MKKILFILIISCILFVAPLAYSADYPGWTRTGSTAFFRTDCVKGYMFMTVVNSGDAIHVKQIMERKDGKMLPMRCPQTKENTYD